VGPVLTGEVHGVSDVVVQLEEVASGADGIPPLLVFVGDVARWATGPAAVAARDWLKKCAERLGVDSAPLLRPALARDPHHAYLVIECRPDGPGNGGYLASAWLQFDDEPGIPLFGDDQPRPLALSGLLQVLLRDERVTNRHAPELTIEFVMPHALLDLPLEQIEVMLDGVRLTIGIVHPVVVRSYERMSRPTPHHDWQQKTARFRAGACGRVVIRAGELDHNRLYAALADPAVVCLTMAFPPWGTGNEHPDELWVGLHTAGVPITLWCRNADRFDKELRDLLDADLITLPQRVRDLRRDAVLTGSGGDFADRLGFQLGLLFDLADRVPAPYLRLRPPA
jgi:hypothetical protein